MKYSKIYILILAVIFLWLTNSSAQVGLNKVAQSTMNFLLVSVSPEASAMGEAYCAVGEGSASIFYNPAGIVETSRSFDVKIYITNWIADINYLAGSAVWNAGIFGSIGVSLLSVDYGTLNGTQLLHPSEIDAYPMGYKDVGSLSNVSAYAAGITYGKAISKSFFLGGNIRYVGQNLGQSLMANNLLKDNNTTKLVFDAGVKYYTGLKSFRFGMVIRNFSSNVKREVIDEQMPLTFTLGAALDLFDYFVPDHSENNSLLLAIDFVHPNNYSERLNLGLEYKFWGLIALRSGYQTNNDLATWSAGIGIYSEIGNNDIEFNYSYSNFDIFSGVNRFSLGFLF